ncbi:uncharacterized protein MONOS_4421 [Monocercomonoides exilis]|uniref:uncharacterized protein n=1 Tax=Monocercomonoides exilis TaxID=2049356 RepID=UPI00355AAAA6|nr:hypothetical protein MONOS_4421 [Monocercomonoides exilis]|eukprot:MONOS_4421.1-p1 / transcript=MONOS_4421.1 / gene=MONOS_4421 / organism=Monocercomonoides_exilis_PA203 / gene_product=unspecified product / transcript_product=unspecified product / location=Mono_scaffold00117:91941-92911(+) / protein_length=184 / sequence_SO=supercontig / SO=protein_coding / is_pseudo=false
MRLKRQRCAEQLKAGALYRIEGGGGMNWAEATSGDYTVGGGEERMAEGVVPDGAAEAKVKKALKKEETQNEEASSEFLEQLSNDELPTEIVPKDELPIEMMQPSDNFTPSASIPFSTILPQFPISTTFLVDSICSSFIFVIFISTPFNRNEGFLNERIDTEQLSTCRIPFAMLSKVELRTTTG